MAIVGRSGSGKSTLVGLLPRFYDVTAGRVLLDGHDVREYGLVDLRRQMSLVSQDVVLFNDTIAANIAFGMPANPSAGRGRGARRRGWTSSPTQLPDGLDTVVGDRGSLLSGGQRQRIAIARALLRDPPILILDEATSALDTELERQIQQQLEQLMQGRTTLVIAHRLSTVEKADRIVVMDAGQDGRDRHARRAAGAQRPVRRAVPDAVQRMTAEHRLLGLWYGPAWRTAALWPLEALYAAGRAVAARCVSRPDLLEREDAGAPVVVVGNLTVGGTGKTPIASWLAAAAARTWLRGCRRAARLRRTAPRRRRSR